MMTPVWQQQVFALDAKYNAYRAKNSPNFRTLYIRRRNQLLRECGSEKDNDELCRQYFKIRSSLLQAKYGSYFDQTSLRRLSLNPRMSPDTSSNQFTAESDSRSRSSEVGQRISSIGGASTIHENYAFVGVHHIFDQHSAPVSMVKFANNDRARLCCASYDSTVSICNVLTDPPSLEFVFKGHEGPVTGCDWSAANDLLVTCSLDGQILVWDTVKYKCIRSVRDSIPTTLYSCSFHPVNNNIVVAGNGKGQVEVLNISTGMKHRSNMGGKVVSLTFESDGLVLWAGNDHGYIMAFRFDLLSGKLSRFRRNYLGEPVPVTSLNWRAWISREGRDPLLLVNLANNSLLLYKVEEKGLQLRKKFSIPHKSPQSAIRSTFCPLMSFRKGACVVTGSEDSSVYIFDVESDSDSKAACVNRLQGHSCPVLGVSFNYDESLLSSSDQQGTVIIWKRASKPSES